MKIKNKLVNIRNKIIKISYETNSAHLGSNLSCLEILYAIFINVKKKNTEVIFSKGHAAIAYYSILEHFKFLNKTELKKFLKPNTKLWSHLTRDIKNKFLKFSFGSLGYGPGISAGLSLAYKNTDQKHRIFCIISDGELNEGSTWESLMFIAHHKLKNIIILIDNNKWQSFGETKKIINLESLDKKFKSFGFSVKTVDGHNISKIINALNKKAAKPKIIICKTVKGKGLKRIENSMESHYIPAKKEDLGNSK